MCGQETPAFRHGEEWPLPLSSFVCLWQKWEQSCEYSQAMRPNAGDSERQRPQGRRDSGCLWAHRRAAMSCPTLAVNRPPDENPVGMHG